MIYGIDMGKKWKMSKKNSSSIDTFCGNLDMVNLIFQLIYMFKKRLQVQNHITCHSRDIICSSHQLSTITWSTMLAISMVYTVNFYFFSLITCGIYAYRWGTGGTRKWLLRTVEKNHQRMLLRNVHNRSRTINNVSATPLIVIMLLYCEWL